jgi:hypothetical protein
MTDNARKTGAAVEAHFQFLMWLVPAVEKFLRTQKFLIGNRIQTTALDVLECLIVATYTRDRKGHLARANLGIEKLSSSPAHRHRQPASHARGDLVRSPRRFVADDSSDLIDPETTHHAGVDGSVGLDDRHDAPAIRVAIIQPEERHAVNVATPAPARDASSGPPVWRGILAAWLIGACHEAA